MQRYDVWKYPPNFLPFSKNITKFAKFKEQTTKNSSKQGLQQKNILKT